MKGKKKPAQESSGVVMNTQAGKDNFRRPVNNLSNTGQFRRIIATVFPPTSVLGSGLGGDSSPRQIQLIAKFIF